MNSGLLLLLLLGLTLKLGAAQNSPPDFDTHDSEGLRVAHLSDEGATDAKTMFWKGYVRGITDALKLSGDVCIPETEKPNKIEQLVARYLESTRGPLHQPAYHTIYSVTTRAYPCTKQN